MVPYFVLILLPFVAGLLGQKYSVKIGEKTLYKSQSFSIDIFMFVFWLLLALRGLECGTDTKQYLVLYEKYAAQSFATLFRDYSHELGYKLICKLVDIFADNYQVLLVITASMGVYPLWYFYKRETDHSLLTIALFLLIAPFVMYFSGIRQAIAMGFGFFAWYAAKNKKKIQFILIVLLAMQFHVSAFILLIIYPLYYAKVTKKWLWGVVPCIAAVYVFRVPIFSFLVKYLWQEYKLTSATGATSILLLLVLFGIYSYVIPDEKSLDSDIVAMRNMLLLSIAIQCFAPVHPLAMRMNYYFLLFIPILIPKIVSHSRIRFVMIARLSTIVLIVYSVYYYLSMIIRDNDALNIIPYIPFWKN